MPNQVEAFSTGNEALPKVHPESLNRSRSTGPRTPEGKARSSQNRLTHGLRSEKTVLRTESQEEFDANMQSWLNRYPTDDELIQALVMQTAKAWWFLLRAQKHLEDVEFELPGNAYHWTDTHQQLLANFTRYKTSAERSFFSLLKELDRRVAAEGPNLPSRHSENAVKSPSLESTAGHSDANPPPTLLRSIIEDSTATKNGCRKSIPVGHNLCGSSTTDESTRQIADEAHQQADGLRMAE